MLDDDTLSPAESTSTTPVRRTRRRAASRPAGPPEATVASSATPDSADLAAEPPAAAATRRSTRKRSNAEPGDTGAGSDSGAISDSGNNGASGSGNNDVGAATSVEPPSDETATESEAAPASKPARKRSTRKKAAPPPADPSADQQTAEPTDLSVQPVAVEAVVGELPAVVGGLPAVDRAATQPPSAPSPVDEQPRGAMETASSGKKTSGTAPPPVALLFKAPDPDVIPAHSEKESRDSVAADAASPVAATEVGQDSSSRTSASRTSTSASTDAAADEAEGEDGGDQVSNRRRRSRGGRNRRKSSDAERSGADPTSDEAGDVDASKDSTASASRKSRAAADDDAGRTDKSGDSTDRSATDQTDASLSQGDTSGTDDEGGSSHRRRRRRRSGADSPETANDPEGTVVRVRAPRVKKDAITSVEGSTRIEAKRQRRREGREASRRPPILSESEFLARRESVERVMAIRQRGETTQIGVLEDNVLVEHYVAIASQSSIIGNVYLGRVQNVLPSMEAAFIDIGRGRNAVLYAGEVNWDTQGNQPRRIESVLKSGQTVLVQVSKDPVGHKGARLTSQITLPGRYLVYVPSGGQSGISRKLPDTERNRLKNLLKEILPEDAGVIIRTAAEGASEEELTRDVTRLTARWQDIEKKIKSGQAPTLLYAEPDTTLKVVRDLFTEDFTKLVISGDDAWDMVDGYVQHVAPDLGDRLERYDGEGDVFADFRIDEQIAKAMERKVWLPSGGSLVIDRTEAMTVVDVNTGKFTGSGGNLEQTVTKNNLEAAEEVVRQLRLRDIGGIIVIDFIDMVLEDNRDLVLRRLVECLGRDRTRHQVAEVTSLGLVQMTRKRISTGLLESFSDACDACQGRGVVIQYEPVETGSPDNGQRGTGSGSGSGSGSRSGSGSGSKAEDGSGASTKRSSSRRRGGKASVDTGTRDPDKSPAEIEGGKTRGAEAAEAGRAEPSGARGAESSEARSGEPAPALT